MRRIKLVFISMLAVLTVAWLFADTLVPSPLTYFSFRSVFMQFSGTIGIGVMSVAMLLALRSRWVEARLDGLDKVYRLHKWLGITALGVAVVHWWWAQGTKWMVRWGWLVRPPRGPRGPVADAGTLEGWLRAQRGLAESVGEWAFYAVVILLVLALVKRFPYHLFKKTHRLVPIAYLALAYHTAVLVKFDYWSQPVGWILAALLLGGCAAAIVSLFGRIGISRKTQGKIEALTYYPALQVLETRIAVHSHWPGHRAGQFAFATSDPSEGAHPYTVASAWNPEERRITFITKALGDHTSRLRARLRPDMPVTIEGPYGCFDFQDGCLRQIWIGAGIGITPFIARMKHLAAQPEAVEIDLFHPTAVYEQAAIDKLNDDAKAAGIRLHVLVSPRDGRLDGARIRTAVPDWLNAGIWFCGPAGFGETLRRDFIAHGLPRHRFYQELFEMR